MSNQQYYLRYRLPTVLENEKKKQKYWQAFSSAKRVLKAVGRSQMISLSQKKMSKSGRRIIGYFSDVEITRLRMLLRHNLKSYIVFHNTKNQVVRLNGNDRGRLKSLLKNSTAINRLVRKKTYRRKK